MLMLDGPPPLWAFGQPAARQPALPAERAGVRELRHGGRRALRRRGRPVHPVERAQPAGVDAAAGRLRRAALHARLAERVSRDGPRRVPGDPRGRPGRDQVLIGALAPAGGDLRSKNANMRPLEFLRGLGCVDGDLHAVRTGACRGFQPAIADGISYHPHSTRHAPSQPYAHPRQRRPREPEEGRAPDRPPAAPGTACGARRRRSACGSTSTATRPTRPTSLRGVSPGAQDRYLQQAAYIAWHDPRVMLLAQYLWQDEPVAGGRKYTGWQSGLHDADGEPEAGAGPLRRARSGSTSATTSCGARSAPGPHTGHGPAPPRRRRDDLGVARHGPDRETTERGSSPRRRSRSRRTAPSRTTAPRARR